MIIDISELSKETREKIDYCLSTGLFRDVSDVLNKAVDLMKKETEKEENAYTSLGAILDDRMKEDMEDDYESIPEGSLANYIRKNIE